MVKQETLTYTFQHPWHVISYASWKKYPCPERPDVLQVDMLRRDFDEDEQVLRTTRLLTLKNQLPGWLQKVTGVSGHSYFLERSVIDSKSKRMVLSGTNITGRSYVVMNEKCYYEPDENNEKWTKFTQEASVTVKPWAIAGQAENFLVNTYKQNAAKGREVMEKAITVVKAETEEKLRDLERLKLSAEENFKGVLPTPAKHV